VESIELIDLAPELIELATELIVLLDLTAGSILLTRELIELASESILLVELAEKPIEQADLATELIVWSNS